LILILKKHAIHSAITSINNSLMQSKIIFTSSELLFPELSVIMSNKILLISASGFGGALQDPPCGVRAGTQSIFRFYIASNPSKAVKILFG